MWSRGAHSGGSTSSLHYEISLARADGRLVRLMASWARTDILLIDDFLLRPLAPDQAADVLEVIEDRVGLRSTIVTSQLPVAMWHEALGEPTVADGILDRLLQRAPHRTTRRIHEFHSAVAALQSDEVGVGAASDEGVPSRE
jgi:DNA replication protein DnaC